ncbi:MAG: tripartite tricarboxylate transporter substrate binding protein, partial [Deltaproteobacteria bacterium]|nr:tripartite tricarboxylate transporter substrate binding protein [Deltaproteobacteria bacterium]
RNLIVTVAIVPALIALVTAGCVDSGKEEERSETEVKKMVAQFPNREIRLICPPKQGGLSDFITRTLAFFSEKAMGAKIVVENRPGAAGATGMRFGANARSDGYTVTYVTVESTILKHRKDIHETVSYADFELLARLNYGPASLSVKADAPWQTFSDFVTHARANPGQLNVGNSGQYSIWHLASAVMADALGVTLGYVPYDGAAPSIQDLLGGHLDAVVSSPSEVFTFVKSNQLRLLAIFGDKRDPQFPKIPTAKELGHDVVVGAWGGLGVPKGTPRGIGDILYRKFKAGFDTPRFRQKCQERSVTLGWQDSRTFARFAKAQDAMFSRILGALSME